ncbi:hypothetical protein [Photobacterium kishitanii]|uniref:Uncharacterized protein n=1 Tax=Photobacterium kishitanii TaxID=318456 RepID=A0A2T3KLU2_9GAMM|nr:hypothetical protein [Photobacterium kishitanii]PSV00674.1 hypothetical protein C9J27_05915 [Photobacterium kishitanii]
MNSIELLAYRTTSTNEFVYELPALPPEDLTLTRIQSDIHTATHANRSSLKYDPIVTIEIETNIKAPNKNQKVFDVKNLKSKTLPSPFTQSNHIYVNGVYSTNDGENLYVSITAKRFFVAERSARKKETIEKINNDKDLKALEFSNLDGAFFLAKEKALKEGIISIISTILSNHRIKTEKLCIEYLPDFISEQIDIMKTEVFEENPILKEKQQAIDLINEQLKMLQRQKSDLMESINSACIDLLYDSVDYTDSNSKFPLCREVKTAFNNTISNMDYGLDVKDQLSA